MIILIRMDHEYISCFIGPKIFCTCFTNQQNLDLDQMERRLQIHVLFNPRPDDKILDWSKLKQIADDILNCI